MSGCFAKVYSVTIHNKQKVMSFTDTIKYSDMVFNTCSGVYLSPSRANSFDFSMGYLKFRCLWMSSSEQKSKFKSNACWILSPDFLITTEYFLGSPNWCFGYFLFTAILARNSIAFRTV